MSHGGGKRLGLSVGEWLRAEARFFIAPVCGDGPTCVIVRHGIGSTASSVIDLTSLLERVSNGVDVPFRIQPPRMAILRQSSELPGPDDVEVATTRIKHR